MIDILLAITIFSILFGIGLSIRIEDLKQIKSKKKALIFGLSAQLIALPILAFFCIKWFQLSPVWALGFFLVAASPGGTMSNFISYVLKGDVLLSVLLTGINSIITIITIPLLTQWGLHHYMQQDFAAGFLLSGEIVKLLALLLVPLLLGFLVNYVNKDRIPVPLSKIKVFNSLLLALVYFLKLSGIGGAKDSGLILNDIVALLPICLTFHFISMLLSFFVAKVLHIHNQQAATIGIEVGLQNTSLAILIASSFLHNNDMAKPALVYAMFSFFTTFVFAYITLKNKQ